MRTRCLVAAAMLGPALASAQRDTSSWVKSRQVNPGATIRIEVGHIVTRAPEAQLTTRYVGRVRAIGHDTLFIAVSDSDMAVPRILITSIQLNRGRDRRHAAGQYGFWGALGGYVAGGVGQPRGWRQDRSRLLGTGIGFLAGYIAGIVFPYEYWTSGWLPE
jgi:hypothetical protein